MKHMRFLAILVAIALLIPLASASAGTFRTATKDTTCLAGGACADNFGVQVVSANQPVVCSDSQIGYIGWDLSALATSIASAELTLTTYNVSGAPVGSLTFELVTPSSHTWTEGGTDPGYGAVIASATATLSNGTSAQTVTFGGSGDTTAANALGVYFEALRLGGNPANSTIGIRISAGCTLSTSVSFNDSENTAGHNPATDPDLIFYPQTDANAVTLATFHAAANEPVNWPLYAGLALILAALAAMSARWAVRRRA